MTTDVRVGARAARAELVGFLSYRGVVCAVGPAEPDGWVVVRLPPGTDPAPLAGELSANVATQVAVTEIDEDGEYAALRVWRDGRVAAGHRWGDDSPEHDDGAVAPALAEALDRDGTSAELAEILLPRDDLDAHASLRAAVALLELPALLVDAPASWVVLCRDEPADVAQLAPVLGPVWLVPLEGGWVLLVRAEGDGPHAVGVGAGLSKGRKRAALVLWRQPDACGYVLWHRGDYVDSHTWDRHWHLIGADPAGPEPAHGDATLLATAFDRPERHVLLRALLRRHGEPDELLAELAELLRLPAPALHVLDGRSTAERLAGARRFERTSWLRAALDANPPRSIWFGPRTLRAFAYVLASTSIGVALVFGLLATLGVAVLATDGAVVDQRGVTGEDWWFTALCVAVTAVTGWYAFSCLRWLRSNKP